MWPEDGACRDQDPALFFPDVLTPFGEEQEDWDPYPALRFCAICPVRHDCRDFAIVNGLRVGVWGGGIMRGSRQGPVWEEYNGRV